MDSRIIESYTHIFYFQAVLPSGENGGFIGTKDCIRDDVPIHEDVAWWRGRTIVLNCGNLTVKGLKLLTMYGGFHA